MRGKKKSCTVALAIDPVRQRLALEMPTGEGGLMFPASYYGYTCVLSNGPLGDMVALVLVRPRRWPASSI
jgi:hypothetical protein